MRHVLTAQVLSLAGELLGKAEELLREGLHVTEIIEGYARAVTKVRRAPADVLHNLLHAVSLVLCATSCTLFHSGC